MRNSPVTVTILTSAVYVFILCLFLAYYRDPREFIQIGTTFVTGSQKSDTIKLDPTYNYPLNGIGYDGQFAYYIALDPANARYYVGRDSYRYTRILYPIVARVLALGKPDWIPFALILTNLLAVTVGTWATAAWCRLQNLSPWLALVYAFFVGQVIAFTRDLTDILAYALVAVAVFIYDRWPQKRLWAALSFGLAALARETTLLFSLLYAMRFLWGDDTEEYRAPRLSQAAIFIAIAAGPAILWQGFLFLWLGSVGIQQGNNLALIPFSGLSKLFPLSEDQRQVVQVVVVPGIVCLCTGLWAFWENATARKQVAIWLLILNAILFVVLLPAPSLFEMLGAARVSTGLALCSIYVLPYIQSRVWFYFCAGLWVTASLTYLLNPALLPIGVK